MPSIQDVATMFLWIALIDHVNGHVCHIFGAFGYLGHC